jgi:hypothetical protein
MKYGAAPWGRLLVVCPRSHVDRVGGRRRGEYVARPEAGRSRVAIFRCWSDAALFFMVVRLPSRPTKFR